VNCVHPLGLLLSDDGDVVWLVDGERAPLGARAETLIVGPRWRRLDETQVIGVRSWLFSRWRGRVEHLATSRAAVLGMKRSTVRCGTGMR